MIRSINTAIIVGHFLSMLSYLGNRNRYDVQIQSETGGPDAVGAAQLSH